MLSSLEDRFMAKPPRKKKRDRFSDQIKLFIEALVAVPNVTRAYQLAYPKSSPASACTSGHRLLRNARVREAVESGRKARLSRYGMEADEAMKRLALIGRADIRLIFDADGTILPVQEWPEEIALAVRAIKVNAFGTSVSLENRLSALEVIASAGGKLGQSQAPQTDVLALLLEHARPEDRTVTPRPRRLCPKPGRRAPKS